MTNRSLLKTRWDDLAGRITEAWGALTDDDMKRLEGRWDQLVAVIREKTGAAVEDIESQLDEMIDSLDMETASH